MRDELLAFQPMPNRPRRVLESGPHAPFARAETECNAAGAARVRSLKKNFPRREQTFPHY